MKTQHTCGEELSPEGSHHDRPKLEPVRFCEDYRGDEQDHGPHLAEEDSLLAFLHARRAAAHALRFAVGKRSRQQVGV